MKTASNNTRIFVVEDDQMYQRMVKYIAEMNPDHEVHVFKTGEECINHLHLRPDIISLDYTLPDMTGAEVLKKILRVNERTAVLVLSGQKDISTAVELVQLGAYDYIEKESNTRDRLINAIERAKKNLAMTREIENLREQLNERHHFKNFIIGTSKPMQRILNLMEKAVNSNITVSISGETGTGKEVVAKAIHHNSKQHSGPFIAVNMSAIPKTLLESELFGYEKGAFTGAATRKKGQFELAHRGTLFLDEIAEMDLNMQAKVLRALQEREFVRVGGEKSVKFDTRIIIATHKDLREEVNQGNFREDLYYRLLGLNIHLPPLYERGNDVVLLAEHFMKQYAKENSIKKIELSREAKAKLLTYSYPGNVRELKAIIDLAAVMSNGQLIQAE
ncbi:MAG: sigma-54 dependent transcriptional regulator, partial [Bacteroidota bacterium]